MRESNTAISGLWARRATVAPIRHSARLRLLAATGSLLFSPGEVRQRAPFQVFMPTFASRVVLTLRLFKAPPPRLSVGDVAMPICRLCIYCRGTALRYRQLRPCHSRQRPSTVFDPVSPRLERLPHGAALRARGRVGLRLACKAMVARVRRRVEVARLWLATGDALPEIIGHGARIPSWHGI